MILFSVFWVGGEGVPISNLRYNATFYLGEFFQERVTTKHKAYDFVSISWWVFLNQTKRRNHENRRGPGGYIYGESMLREIYPYVHHMSLFSLI